VSPVTPFEVPRPYFQPKGVTHKEEAIGFPGAPEREAVMLDLKDVSFPPVTKAGVPGGVPARRARGKRSTTNGCSNGITPGRREGPSAQHIHERDSVEVFFDPGTIRYRAADGKEETKTFKRKDARFVPRGRSTAKKQSAVRLARDRGTEIEAPTAAAARTRCTRPNRLPPLTATTMNCRPFSM
jgi:hypothetical protein